MNWGQAGTKKENLPPRHKGTKGFYYKKFFFVTLGVLVPLWPFFYILPENGKILRLGNLNSHTSRTPPQAYICPKGAIPSFHFSGIPSFQL
jgi:hypothetical protein